MISRIIHDQTKMHGSGRGSPSEMGKLVSRASMPARLRSVYGQDTLGVSSASGLQYTGGFPFVGFPRFFQPINPRSFQAIADRSPNHFQTPASDAPQTYGHRRPNHWVSRTK